MSNILRWENVKTRKPHRCFGCGILHDKGTLMVSAAYADGGSVSGCYWCNVCEEYMRRHFSYDDEISYAEIYENDPQGWEAIKKELEQDGTN